MIPRSNHILFMDVSPAILLLGEKFVIADSIEVDVIGVSSLLVVREMQ